MASPGMPPGYLYPPLGRPPGSPPPDLSKAFPVQAAKFSLYSAIFAFLINFVTVQGGGGMPRAWFGAIAILCAVLILAGFVLGIAALVQNRRRNLPGVRGYAIAGIVINGLFIALNIVLFGALLLR